MNRFWNRKLCWATGLLIIILTGFLGFGRAAEAEMTAAMFNDTSDRCLSCHSNQSSNKYIDQVKFKASIHGALGCNACHLQAMNSLPHEGKAVDALQMCSACHSSIGKEYSNSVHGKLFVQGVEELGCTSCHGNSHAIVPGTNPASPVAHLNVVRACASCHEGEVVESYLNSFHGIANKFGSETTAQCVSCHGSHNILGPDDPASAVAKANVPAGCAGCHGGEALANFAEGPEHFAEKPGTPGAPMFWTLKFFIWLTIIVVTLLIIHMELELLRRLKKIKS